MQKKKKQKQRTLLHIVYESRLHIRRISANALVLQSRVFYILIDTVLVLNRFMVIWWLYFQAVYIFKCTLGIVWLLCRGLCGWRETRVKQDELFDGIHICNHDRHWYVTFVRSQWHDLRYNLYIHDILRNGMVRLTEATSYPFRSLLAYDGIYCCVETGDEWMKYFRVKRHS